MNSVVEKLRAEISQMQASIKVMEWLIEKWENENQESSEVRQKGITLDDFIKKERENLSARLYHSLVILASTTDGQIRNTRMGNMQVNKISDRMLLSIRWAGKKTLMQFRAMVKYEQ